MPSVSAVQPIPSLNWRDCQAHSTAMLSQVEEQLFRKLGVDITSDAEYQSSHLYYV